LTETSLIIEHTIQGLIVFFIGVITNGQVQVVASAVDYY